MELQQMFEFLSDHFARLEARIDNMVTRREYETQQKDIDRAHEKHRQLEERVRSLETSAAGERGENKGRFTMTEKILGVVLALVTAAALAGLGLR